MNRSKRTDRLWKPADFMLSAAIGKATKKPELMTQGGWSNFKSMMKEMATGQVQSR